jgi:hypothetical protein
MRKVLVAVAMIASVFSVNAQMERKISANIAATSSISPNNGKGFWSLGGQAGLLSKLHERIYIGGGLQAEQICDNVFTVANKYWRVTPYGNLQTHLGVINDNAVFFDAKCGYGISVSKATQIDTQNGAFYSVGLGAGERTYKGFYGLVAYKLETQRVRENWLPIISKQKYHGFAVNLGYRF